MLRRIPEPVFYEMFLEFVDEMGNARLWPVPIENPAIQASGQGEFSLLLGRDGRHRHAGIVMCLHP